MSTFVDPTREADIQGPATAVEEALSPPDDGTIETHLAEEINDLWTSNVRLSGDRKATAKELRVVRARLAERLAAMKALLSRPGRGGQWSAWLKEKGIPRSSADRLAARHCETAEGPPNENVPTGAITDQPDDAILKLARSVWLRYGKVLVKPDAVVRFLAGIASSAGAAHEWRDEGLVILHTPLGPLDGEVRAESGIEPASLSSDEGVAAVAECLGSAKVGETAVDASYSGG